MVTETMRVEPDMGDEFPDGDGKLPPSLRLLRNLVTVLTVVMILGVITIVGLLVMGLNDTSGPLLVDPEMFAVPEGVGLVGYSVVEGYTVLVGDDGVIRVFASDTRALVQEIDLTD